jgi:hypothetical protein
MNISNFQCIKCKDLLIYTDFKRNKCVNCLNKIPKMQRNYWLRISGIKTLRVVKNV